MIDLVEPLEEGLAEILNSATANDRLMVAGMLFNQFVKSTRKRPVPDLDQRMAKLKDDIDTMCLAMKFSVKLNESCIVVSAEGPAGETLLKLSNGTDWHEGRDIGDDIVKSLRGQSS
jgi:hypothetical protein